MPTGPRIEAVERHNEREPERRVVFAKRLGGRSDPENEKCSSWRFRLNAGAGLRMALRRENCIARANLGQPSVVGKFTMASRLNVTLRQMRAFVEAYRLRNLTHAADALHVTQSAMSALIRQFEEELGCSLFERTPRVLRPTKAADDAYRQVVAILKSVQSLGDDMQARAEGFERVLSFSCPPGLAASVIPPVLASFKKQYPDVKVVLRDSYDASLIERVLTEEVEFSIGFFDHEPETVVSQALIVDHLCAVCERTHPLAQKERVCWRDMLDQPIIRIAGGPLIQQLITEALSKSGGTMRPAYQVTFLHTALALGAQGLGVLILPGYLVRENPHMSSLVARKLHDPLVERSLLVHTRQGHTLSSVATTFIEMTREHLQCPA